MTVGTLVERLVEIFLHRQSHLLSLLLRTSVDGLDSLRRSGYVKYCLQLIQRLENFVGADGKVDVNEAKSILGLVTPLAEVDAGKNELA